MTQPAGRGSDEARAIALLQHLSVLCDETRRTASADPSRIEAMLSTFEETLATLAPMLERVGRSPGASLEAVQSAARQVANSHQSLIDAMSLELDRLGRALADTDHAANATQAYGHVPPAPMRTAFHAIG